ncbi:MAG: hypothetical protein NTU49_05000 [Gammaproteobacteria bacterium]|nr:hypothetical protein [Gammaproteobacteria bacterium]
MPDDTRRNAKIDLQDIEKGIAQHEKKTQRAPGLFQSRTAIPSPPRTARPTGKIAFKPCKF